MKALFAIILTLIVSTLTAQDKYTEAMLKNIDAAYHAKTVAEHQATANARLNASRQLKKLNGNRTTMQPLATL
jgi:hypothetical protein